MSLKYNHGAGENSPERVSIVFSRPLEPKHARLHLAQSFPYLHAFIHAHELALCGRRLVLDAPPCNPRTSTLTTKYVFCETSLQDYARRLSKLRSLRDIFEEYATVNADDVGQLMTCGDFLRAMVR